MTAGGSVGGVVSGLGLHLESLGLLRREPTLRRLAAVPLVVSLGMLCATLFLLVQNAPELYGLVTSWMPTPRAHAWYAWVWVGPARTLLGVLGAVLLLLVAGVALVAAFLVSGVLAAPFHDALARRVEALVSGGVEDLAGEGWLALLREGSWAVLEELRRLVFFLAIQAAILGLGLVLPGGALAAPLAMALVTILFLPLDYASYALDRRRVPFRGRRHWISLNRGAMLGFGSGAFVTCLVPGLNFVAAPVLVVGGTLLVLHHPPPEEGGAGGVPT